MNANILVTVRIGSVSAPVQRTNFRQTDSYISRKKKTSMRKLKYAAPELTIVAFEAAGIITTSIGAYDGEWVPIGDGTPDEYVF